MTDSGTLPPLELRLNAHQTIVVQLLYVELKASSEIYQQLYIQQQAVIHRRTYSILPAIFRSTGMPDYFLFFGRAPSRRNTSSDNTRCAAGTFTWKEALLEPTPQYF